MPVLGGPGSLHRQARQVKAGSNTWLAGIKESGVTWRQFTEALEAMRTRGTSNPADSPVLDEARKRPPPQSAQR